MYLLSGGGDRSDWVRNIMVSPAVTLRIGAVQRATRARVVDAGTDEDAIARRLLLDEVHVARPRGPDGLGADALPVAVDWPSDGEAP